jgi:hypothetical protein
MKSLLIALASLPLMVGAASAATPLSDGQMDQVNAGNFYFIPISVAAASAHATAHGGVIDVALTDTHVTASPGYASSSSSSIAATVGVLYHH